MKKKVVYITQWIAKDTTKEYPHGYGFIAPVVEFPQDKDPAWVAQQCRENLSNDEFECYSVVPAPFIDGMFEILGEVQDDLTDINQETLSKGLSVVYWNMARNLSREDFTTWMSS